MARQATTRGSETAPGLLRVGRVLEDQDAQVGEQASVAVFGQAGQAVQVDDLEARGLQRLDQGVAEPLRQLVDRDQAVGGVGALQRGMPPAVAQVDAAQASGGPARSVRRPRAAIPGWRGRAGGRRRSERLEQHVGQAARAGAHPPARTGRDGPSTGDPGGAAAAARPSSPTRGLASDTWNALGQVGGGQQGQGDGVDAPRIVRRRGEGAGLEHAQGGDGQAFGSGQGPAGPGVAVVPARPGAGVQQDGTMARSNSWSGRGRRRRASRCCRRPGSTGRRRRRRNAASGRGRARPGVGYWSRMTAAT